MGLNDGCVHYKSTKTTDNRKSETHGEELGPQQLEKEEEKQAQNTSNSEQEQDEPDLVTNNSGIKVQRWCQ